MASCNTEPLLVFLCLLLFQSRCLLEILKLCFSGILSVKPPFVTNEYCSSRDKSEAR